MNDEQDKLDRLDSIMERIETPVTQLYVNQQQHRKVLRALAVSLIFDILLSFGLGALGWKLKTDVNQKARVQCEAGNEFRRLDLERWNFLLNLQPAQPQTQAQKQQAAVFRAFIEQADAQRSC